jgi:hypothetical protein
MSLDDRREERIPPRAPAFETSGGMITRSPGNAAKTRPIWGSTAVPARMSSSGVRMMTAAISSWIRLASGRSVRAPRKVA